MKTGTSTQKRIYLTVTNDLSYDQRMHRICGTLAQQGYRVMLVGRRRPGSVRLDRRAWGQKRLRCFFDKGFLFYAEYNIRLFFYLLLRKPDAICAIDLDTILPCLAVSRLKGCARIYDAHEYFTEMKEVRTRPRVQRLWLRIERYAVPQFPLGYTVSEGLATAFREAYGRDYTVIRNLPVLKELHPCDRTDKFLLYQGAVNEARGFEYLIPAMRRIRHRLVICGDGNFMPQLKKLIRHHGVGNKVELKGMLTPDALWRVSREATLGIGLAEKEGINQFHALPNKFFDYMHAALPQIAMDYPEYRRINARFPVAILLENLEAEQIAETVNEAMENDQRLEEMRSACLQARDEFHWGLEATRLVAFYKSVFEME